MTQATQAQARPTLVDDGLEIEQCTAEEEAKPAFDAVASYVKRQAAAFVAKAAQRMSEHTVKKGHTDGIV